MGAQTYFSGAGMNGNSPQAVRPLTGKEHSGRTVGEDSDMEEIEFEDSFLKSAWEHGNKAPTTPRNNIGNESEDKNANSSSG